MRVVVASDKFAGTLTALEACTALASGWLKARPKDNVRCVPMADGGPGTVDAVAATGHGIIQVSMSVDQIGRPVQARWLSMDKSSALIEVSSVCGLALVDPSQRQPTHANTCGVGRLIEHVGRLGYRRIIVGLGGSGTIEGGVGAAMALGARMLDPEGGDLALTDPLDYDRIASVTPVSYAVPELVAACDVRNPLLGSQGAARVFGPQKGASPELVDLLERRLAALADAVESSLPGGPWRDLPGAGAAGGLGFGLMAWGKAQPVSGAKLVADLVGLREHLEWADVVITGEGSLDRQTRLGKAPGFVAELAARQNRPVVAVAGKTTGEVASLFSHVETLGQEGLSNPFGSTVRAGTRLGLRWT